MSSNNANTDALAAVHSKVGAATKVMQENVDAALLHCDRLETIELKSQDLDQSAAVFRDRARQLRYKLWWRAMRMKIAVGAFVILVVGAVVTVAVLAMEGGGEQRRR